MMRTLTTVAALLSLALLSPPAATAQTQPASTRPATQPATTRPSGNGATAYHNGEHRFRLNYPAAWEWRDNVPGAVAFFAGPLHEDGTRPVVQVTVMPVPQNKTEMEANKPLTLAAISERMVNSLKNNVQDADVERVEDAKLAGAEAKCITYTGTFHNDTYKFVQTVCVDGERVYVVTYANLEEHAGAAEEGARGILTSFEFVR